MTSDDIASMVVRVMNGERLSIGDVADIYSADERTARRWLDSFYDAGILKVEQEKTGGRPRRVFSRNTELYP